MFGFRFCRSESMPRSRFSMRAGLPVGCAAALLASCLWSIGAAANPLPSCLLYIQPQPWNGNYCATNPIDQCNQIVQHTEAEGDIEFDIFMDNRLLVWSGLDDYEWVHLDMRWNIPGWTYQYAENCPAGYVDEQLSSQRSILDFHFDPPLSTHDQEVTLLGRVRMNVAGFGHLAVATGGVDGYEWLGCGSNEGLAGVECDYWVMDCAFWPGCGADLRPEVLDLDVYQGDRTEGTFDATIGTYHMEGPCPVDFLEDEPYMSLRVQPGLPGHANVIVTIDSSQLPVGLTEGIVRADSDSRDCATVRINVLDSSGVPVRDPAGQLVSWGKIKTLYRD